MQRLAAAVQGWNQEADAARASVAGALPGDAQVLAVVNDFATEGTTVICASGGLPGELHKLWRTPGVGGYHLEYGYSCMGYEIAAGIGVKMADPGREVVVLVGDGGYLMANSELATAATLGHGLIVVLLDNGGFGCIERLQAACGGESFNNLLPAARAGKVDFTAHAAALGAHAEHVAGLASLAAALDAARVRGGVSVIVIDTDPAQSTEAGGAWWDVPVAEVSDSENVRAASQRYRKARDA
jgi:3D-(3,5/4)-trihydroxycyclohexane-1,2-dione acylhydrolase (decyclizing)